MCVHQALARDQAKPQEHRQRRRLHILTCPAKDFDVRFLDHVGWVNPTLQAPVETDTDHPLQPISVLGKQLHERALIPFLDPPQQGRFGFRSVGHGWLVAKTSTLEGLLRARVVCPQAPQKEDKST
jgi:hypothetical protein